MNEFQPKRTVLFSLNLEQVDFMASNREDLAPSYPTVMPQSPAFSAGLSSTFSFGKTDSGARQCYIVHITMGDGPTSHMLSSHQKDGSVGSFGHHTQRFRRSPSYTRHTDNFDD